MKKLTALVMYCGLLFVASGSASADDGADTYKLVCSSCHASAAAGAPKLEDKAQWKSRLAQGMDALYASTLDGKCELFVKELRVDLSDEVIKSAVDYMVSQVQ